MRSKLVVVVLLLVACKGKESKEQPKNEPPKSAPRAEVQAQAALPAHFPLPASTTKKLVRSSSRLSMDVWEYEYQGIAAKDVAKQIEAGMLAAAYKIQNSATAGETLHVQATYDGRTYAVATRPYGGATSVTIRSFPEAGPPTLPAPATYPTTFPFLAGGTASHAADGAKLRIAYQSDPKDIESAMSLAAKTAGWECTGGGTVTCTKDKATVTFATEAAPGGSLLVVSAP